MPDASETTMRFTLDGFADDTFHVVRFNGTEKCSKLFTFEILLAAQDATLDLAKALAAKATLKVRPPSSNGQKAEEAVFQGVLASAESLQGAGLYTLYRVVMMPRLQRLLLATNNRIFLEKDLTAIATEVLEGADFAQGVDFEISFKEEHEPREYTCQYQESDYNFLARRLENEGGFFFFDTGDGGDKCVIADAHVFKDCPGGPLDYLPGPSPEHASQQKFIHEFARKFTAKSGIVAIRDVNYRKDMHHILAQQNVHLGTQIGSAPSAFGEVHLFGANVKTTKQGKRLATIAAQQLACEREQFYGASHCPYFRPGRTFTLKGHDNQSFNAKYLLTKVVHKGHQEGLLARTLGVKIASSEDQKEEAGYSNTFTAIPNDVVFRSERRTTRPSIHGILNATIDAQGSGEYAEIDDHGRYKVILPFDRSGRKDGKASAWLRMAQPYAGSNHGLHLPLHKGCEVALMFHDGDPDRPVIVGALSNPHNPSPVTSKEPAHNTLSTAHGNSMIMGDVRGKQHLRLHNTDSKTTVRLGANMMPPALANEAMQKQGASKDGDGDSGGEGNKGWASDQSAANFFKSNAFNCDNYGDASQQGSDAAKNWFQRTKVLDPSEKPGKHGLQFDTPDWISIYAGTQSSVFFGEYGSAVFGSFNSANIGIPLGYKLGTLSLFPGIIGGWEAAKATKDFGLGAIALAGALPTKLTMNVALALTWNILEATTLIKAKKEINLFKKKVEGETSEASKSAKRIQASKQYLIEQKVQVVDEKMRAEVSSNALKGEVDKLENDVKTASEEETRSAGEKAELVREKKQLASEKETLSGSVTSGTNESAALYEELEELYGEYESVKATVERLGETKEELMGLEEVTAGEVNRILGEYGAL